MASVIAAWLVLRNGGKRAFWLAWLILAEGLIAGGAGTSFLLYTAVSTSTWASSIPLLGMLLFAFALAAAPWAYYQFLVDSLPVHPFINHRTPEARFFLNSVSVGFPIVAVALTWRSHWGVISVWQASTLLGGVFASMAAVSYLRLAWHDPRFAWFAAPFLLKDVFWLLAPFTLPDVFSLGSFEYYRTLLIWVWPLAHLVFVGLLTIAVVGRDIFTIHIPHRTLFWRDAAIIVASALVVAFLTRAQSLPAAVVAALILFVLSAVVDEPIRRMRDRFGPRP